MSTIGEGILAMLESGPKTISELYEGVPGKRASIDKARWRLVKSGEIESVDHGVYRKKPVLRARPLGKISWKDLTDDEKTNYELNRISDVIEMCCNLIDTSADGQSLTIFERLEVLEGLFSSCSNFVESSSKALRSLEAEWKADGVDVDALYRESYPEKTPLKIMIVLLLDAILEKGDAEKVA